MSTASSSSSSDDLLAEILRAPAHQQAERLEEICASRPELAADLRRRHALLKELGVPLIDPEMSHPERVGDFHLLERLGAGGMGVVYRAMQESLGREVALKLIRPEQMFFPGARKRFQREVEAVARLQHPGIVPVYTVGTEGELPWFAMELMRGATLAEVLRLLADRAPESLTGAELLEATCSLAGTSPTADGERRFTCSYAEACIEISRQIAEALDHAHERGILHRDVKPSNVVLTVDGRAMLLDFGLTSSADGERITRTGSAVGTLHYMSPEQIQGREVDTRADVYSLGVSLYELLALQAPYQGEDRSEIERRIHDGNPDSLRSRNRRVTADAEQVCRKAMDPDPARRYGSAAAFARDLRNLLDHRPVEAKPPGPGLRLRRWIQRQPAMAASLVGAFLLTAGIPTALGLQQIDHNRDLQASLQREQQSSQEARLERDRARQRAAQYGTMTNFLVEMFDEAEPEVGGDGVVTASGLLEAGVARIHTSLLDQPRTRAALLASLSQAYHALGRHGEALRLARESLDQLEELETPDSDLQSRCLDVMAIVQATAGDPEEADRLVTQALALAESSPEPDQNLIFTLLLHRGDYRTTAMRFDDAEADFRVLLASPELQRLEPAERAYFLRDFGSFLTNRAQNLPLDERKGAFEEAEPLLQEAVDTLRGLPEAPLRRLGTAAMTLGLNIKHQGRLEEAAGWYAEAREALVQVQGEDTTFLGICMINEAGVLETLGRYEEAVPRSREGVEILALQLPQEHPSMIMVRGNLAGTLFRAGRHAESEEIYRSVIPLQEQHFGEKHPAVPVSYLNLGRCRIQSQDLEGARAAFLRSLELYTLQRGEGHPESWRAVAGLFDLHLGQKEMAEARARLEEAETLVAEQEAYGLARQLLGMRRGRLLMAEGKTTDALEAFRVSAEWLEGNSVRTLDSHTARAHQLSALVALGRLEEAELILDRLIPELEGRVAPDSPLALMVDSLRQAVDGG